ncbi:LCP family protein [Clostridium sp.]|uniref:LCP family protein n=1 Tax=Clostridium sp. TaxID=1506 RepID=UPI00346472FA
MSDDSKKRVNRKKKNKKSKKKFKIIVSSLIALILISIGAAYYIVHSKISKINTVDLDTSKEALGIDGEKTSNDIINIALFGVDKSENEAFGRSDSTMVLTIDKSRSKLKLTSILRDSYVPVDGHGKTKLNHAYAYGGPQLAVKTLNKNFGLNIEDFIMVDFSTLPKIIDAMGGIDMNIKDYELKMVNQYIKDSAKRTGEPYELIPGTGMQHLSGIQALAYCRIRYVGNGDLERTDRQRNVLEEMFKKVTSLSLIELNSLIDEVLPYIKTSLTSSEIISLSSGSINYSFEQNRFPQEGYYEGKILDDGLWYEVYDINETKGHMLDYIYKDIKSYE